MRALILAAGMGWRLGRGYPPKSLIEFGGKSLLQRHLELLAGCGIGEAVIGIGYRGRLIRDALARMRVGLGVRTVYNPHYGEGNIVTLWRLAEHLASGEDVLLMDADVLYDARLLKALIGSAHRSCLLLDRRCEPGDEPVKVCIRDGRIVELGKRVDPSVAYDYYGESVGFFKLGADFARRLGEVVERFIVEGEREALYEEAIRRLILSDPGAPIGYHDVTGLPWTEVDFHSDIERARRDVLPRLLDSTETDFDAA